MIKATLVALAIICSTASAQAQTFSADDLARRTIERRAVEAVNWGMPAVNYDLMVQAMLDANGASTRSSTGRGLFRLEKPDAHAQSRRDLSHAVLQHEGRRPDGARDSAGGDEGSITGTIMDAWQAALEDVGPAGVDKGKGGKYLILPPGYKDSAAGRLHRAAVADLSGLRAAALDPQERQRRRRRQGRRLRQADQALSALAGGQSARDRLRRCDRRRVRLHDPLRPALLPVARPHRAERAMADRATRR